MDFLEIDGDVATQHAGELEDAIWQHLPDLRPVSDDLFGAYQDRTEVRHSSPLALTQLLTTITCCANTRTSRRRSAHDESLWARCWSRCRGRALYFLQPSPEAPTLSVCVAYSCWLA